jgi:hypothetical protein
MIIPTETLAWLQHRIGLHKLDSHPNQYKKRSLELNEDGDSFISAFGQKEIRGYVGFIDLVGFSKSTIAMSPSQMSAYLKSFLEGVIAEMTECGALIDKTIGDEVMFVLPDMGEDGGVPASLIVGSLVTKLIKLQKRLGKSYPFRLGLSYGSLFIDHIEGKGYSEWTVVGESVNLAKRLQTLKGIEPIDGFAAAFGMLVKEISDRKFEVALNAVSGCKLTLTCAVQPEEVSLKGVSPARCAILRPIEEAFT